MQHSSRSRHQVLRALGLLAMLMACCMGARADVSDIALLGDQANLMGGAVTASTQAGPSMWYNPARLSFAGKQTVVFAISGTGVALRLYRAPALIETPGQNAAGNSTELLALPRATTLVVQAHEKLRWGVGIFIPTRQDVALQATQQGLHDGADTFSSYSLRTRRNSVHFTSALSWELSKRLQVGASLGFVTCSLVNSRQLSSAGSDPSTDIVSGALIAFSQVNNTGYGFRPTLGVSFQLLDSLNLGVSVAAPTVLFFKRVLEVESVLSAVAAADSIRFQPSSRDGRSGAFEGVEPGVARVGLSYRLPIALLEVDGEMTGGAQSADFAVNAKLTGNVRAGALLEITRTLRMGMGFFTDLDNPNTKLTRFGDASMRGLGGTFGINLLSAVPRQLSNPENRQGTYSITLASRYAHFKGDVLGLSVTEAGAPDGSAAIKTAAQIYEVAAQIGINGAW